MSTALEPYLHMLMTKNPLPKEKAEEAMALMVEEADPLPVSAFLALLKYRGETPEEIAGMVQALERKAMPVSLPYPVLDIVGTGGDLAHTVNISTGAAILAAACGVPVAKHGNRSVSSRSGSADVLEALGMEIEVPPAQIHECLHMTNFAFMFAPYYHPCLKKIGAVRRGLKLPTVFNLLGPLLNPAKAEYALIGVASEAALELISQVVLQMANKKRALVYHGCGLDELTSIGPVAAYDITEGKMERLEIDPCALGFAPCTVADLRGGNAVLNASILKEAFAGKESAVADALAFTAGAGLMVFGKASSLGEGIEIARQALREGKALRVLEQGRAFSEKLQAEKRQWIT
jgi:anthranilate phosphoribosyltransferase